jgi:protein TonB
VAGEGGGTGNDGTAGTGPGTGGGTGSGVGTGTGSGTGPGTGGGNGTIYTPQPLTVFIPPMPAPSSVRNREIVAEFDVDSTGRVISVTFTPTRDRGYDKRLRELFAEMKWRPATRPDGTPVRAKASVSYTL